MLLGIKNTTDTSSLIKTYLTRNAEEFAFYSIHDKLRSLPGIQISVLYKKLMYAPNQTRNTILRNPLFKSCLKSFSNYVINDNEFNKFDASQYKNILETIFYDFGIYDTTYLRTDHFGKLYLPNSKIVIQLSSKSSQFPIKVIKNQREIIICDFWINIDSLPYFSTYDINGLKLIVWNLNHSNLTVDALSLPLIQCIPEEWKLSLLNSLDIYNWNTVIAKASELINLSSENQIVWSETCLFTEVLVPVDSFNNQRHLSCSTINLLGVVCMSYTQEETQIAQALIHESGHNKLFHYELSEELIKSKKDTKLISPWRKDLRPPRGLLHGAFSFAGVAVAWYNLMESGKLEGHQLKRIVNECAVFKKQIYEALETLSKNCELTETGNEVYQSIISETSKIKCNQIYDIPQKQPVEEIFDPLDKEFLNNFEEFRKLKLLFLEFIKELRFEIESSELPDWIIKNSIRIAFKYIEYYIPVYEYLSSDSRIQDILSAHIFFGLMWRFEDYLLDNQLESRTKQAATKKAANLYFIKATLKLKNLGIEIDYRNVNECYDFIDYSITNEMKGQVHYEDIWKRGTPFLVIPNLFVSDITFIDMFKKYINYTGIIDDIMDFENDKVDNVYTWVNITADKYENCKSNTNIINALRDLEQQLIIYTKNDFPVWNKLILENKFKIANLGISYDLV